MSSPWPPASAHATCCRAGPWHDSQFTWRVVYSVRYVPASGSNVVVIWLPWHSWQLAKRSTVPMGRRGGQSPQSAMRMSAVMGTHPRFRRLPVLQNHRASARDQSHARKRWVPSARAVMKPWVPPPSMWPFPMTPST